MCACLWNECLCVFVEVGMRLISFNVWCASECVLVGGGRGDDVCGLGERCTPGVRIQSFCGWVWVLYV